MISAYAWKVEEKNSLFRVQIETNDYRHSSKIMNYMMKENLFSLSGEGFDRKEKKIIIFTKKFKSSYLFIKWAKQFPWELKEINLKNKMICLNCPKKEKKLKPLKVKKMKIPKRDKSMKYKRQCKLCKEYGHTVKTCRKNK